MKLYPKNKTLKFFFVVMISTILSIIIHQIHGDPLMNLSFKTPSIIITSGLFPSVAFFALAMTYGILGLIFLGIQKHLWGSKLRKGLVFGLAISGVWMIGMTEAHVLFRASLFSEIFTGFADCCGILLMCLLLGKNFAEHNLLKTSKPKTSYLAIIIITIMYVLIRYFSYSILNIESAYITYPLGTLIWTMAMGAWIGFMYTLMDLNIYPGNQLKQALFFGGVIFGVQWVIFNLFALLFIVVPVSDLLLRSGFDVIAIILGVYFFALKRA
ncbi:MAG: hypothetical protein KAR45_23730 [Desulfobacteraceae bacterium]|nr:hypothetical protein [Desulfobacteraceae bacterium]